MFGWFKRKAASDDSTSETLKEIAKERFQDPEKREALKEELEAIAKGRDISTLEATLLGVQMGQADLGQLLGALEAADVLILTKTHEDLSDLLVLIDPKDKTSRIAIFSSNDRAVGAVQRHDGYRCLVSVAARNLFLNLADGAGIVLNPYEPIITYNLSPEQFSVYKKCIEKLDP